MSDSKEDIKLLTLTKCVNEPEQQKWVNTACGYTEPFIFDFSTGCVPEHLDVWNFGSEGDRVLAGSVCGNQRKFERHEFSGSEPVKWTLHVNNDYSASFCEDQYQVIRLNEQIIQRSISVLFDICVKQQPDEKHDQIDVSLDVQENGYVGVSVNSLSGVALQSQIRNDMPPCESMRLYQGIVPVLELQPSGHVQALQAGERKGEKVTGEAVVEPNYWCQIAWSLECSGTGVVSTTYVDGVQSHRSEAEAVGAKLGKENLCALLIMSELRNVALRKIMVFPVAMHAPELRRPSVRFLNLPYLGSDSECYSLHNVVNEGSGGPFWRDSAFFGLFADAFIENTVLEGGLITPSLAVIQMQLKRVLHHQDVFPWLNRCSRMRNALKDLRAVAVSSLVFSRRLDLAIHSPPLLASVVLYLVQRIADMPMNSCQLLPGGWRGSGDGHAITYIVERVGNQEYTLTVTNTGEGIEYHPRTPSSKEVSRYMLSVTLAGLTRDRICSASWWMAVYQLFVKQDATNGAERLYTVILPALCARPLVLAINDGMSLPVYTHFSYHLPQRAGTCFFRCVQESMYYLSLRLGLSTDEFIRLKQAWRAEAMLMILHDQDQEKQLSDNDLHLLRICVHTLCFTAKSMASSSGQDAVDMTTVVRLAEKVQQRVQAHCAAVYTRPVYTLHLGSDSSRLRAWAHSCVTRAIAWVVNGKKGSLLIPSKPALKLPSCFKFPYFDRFPRLSSVEGHAGSALPLPSSPHLNILQLTMQLSPENVQAHESLKPMPACRSVREVLEALTTTVHLQSQITLLSDALPWSTQTRIILIKRLFTQRIPLPDVQNPNCIWTSPGSSSSTQGRLSPSESLHMMNMLTVIMEHMSASAMSLVPTKYTQMILLTLGAAVVTLADATMRKLPYDDVKKKYQQTTLHKVYTGFDLSKPDVSENRRVWQLCHEVATKKHSTDTCHECWNPDGINDSKECQDPECGQATVLYAGVMRRIATELDMAVMQSDTPVHEMMKHTNDGFGPSLGSYSRQTQITYCYCPEQAVMRHACVSYFNWLGQTNTHTVFEWQACTDGLPEESTEQMISKVCDIDGFPRSTLYRYLADKEKGSSNDLKPLFLDRYPELAHLRDITFHFRLQQCVNIDHLTESNYRDAKLRFQYDDQTSQQYVVGFGKELSVYNSSRNAFVSGATIDGCARLASQAKQQDQQDYSRFIRKENVSGKGSSLYDDLPLQIRRLIRTDQERGLTQQPYFEPEAEMTQLSDISPILKTSTLKLPLLLQHQSTQARFLDLSRIFLQSQSDSVCFEPGILALSDGVAGESQQYMTVDVAQWLKLRSGNGKDSTKLFTTVGANLVRCYWMPSHCYWEHHSVEERWLRSEAVRKMKEALQKTFNTGLSNQTSIANDCPASLLDRMLVTGNAPEAPIVPMDTQDFPSLCSKLNLPPLALGVHHSDVSSGNKGLGNTISVMVEDILSALATEHGVDQNAPVPLGDTTPPLASLFVTMPSYYSQCNCTKFGTIFEELTKNPAAVLGPYISMMSHMLSIANGGLQYDNESVTKSFLYLTRLGCRLLNFSGYILHATGALPHHHDYATIPRLIMGSSEVVELKGLHDGILNLLQTETMGQLDLWIDEVEDFTQAQLSEHGGGSGADASILSRIASHMGLIIRVTPMSMLTINTVSVCICSFAYNHSRSVTSRKLLIKDYVHSLLHLPEDVAIDFRSHIGTLSSEEANSNICRIDPTQLVKATLMVDELEFSDCVDVCRDKIIRWLNEQSQSTIDQVFDSVTRAMTGSAKRKQPIFTRDMYTGVNSYDGDVDEYPPDPPIAINEVKYSRNSWGYIGGAENIGRFGQQAERSVVAVERNGRIETHRQWDKQKSRGLRDLTNMDSNVLPRVEGLLPASAETPIQQNQQMMLITLGGSTMRFIDSSKDPEQHEVLGSAPLQSLQQTSHQHRDMFNIQSLNVLLAMWRPFIGSCLQSCLRPYSRGTLTPAEKWVGELLDNVLESDLGTHLSRYTVNLPGNPVEQHAGHVRVELVGVSGVEKELVLLKDRELVLLFDVFAQGSRSQRSLVYCSNEKMNYADWDQTDEHVYYEATEAGDPTLTYRDLESWVLIRDHCSPLNWSASPEKLIDPKALIGLIPQQLLNGYVFYQDADDNMRGYPRRRTVSASVQSRASGFTYHMYMLYVELCEEPGDNAPRSVHARIWRCSLTPEHEECLIREYVGKKLPDPAIQGKKDMLINIQYQPAESSMGNLATALARVERLSYVLVWATESVSSAGPNEQVLQMDTVESSPLTPVADQESAARLIKGVLRAHLPLQTEIELPRLGIRFQPQYSASEPYQIPEDLPQDLRNWVDTLARPTSTPTLHQAANTSLLLTSPAPSMTGTLRSLPNSLQLSHTNGDHYVMLPFCPIQRKKLPEQPFHQEFTVIRSALSPYFRTSCDLVGTKNIRCMFLRVDPCCQELRGQSEEGALYLAYLLLLSRDYVNCINAIQHVHNFYGNLLTVKAILELFRSCVDDYSPDAHACRLHLAYVQRPRWTLVPFNLTVEYDFYIKKLAHVTEACLLQPFQEFEISRFCTSVPKLDLDEELQMREQIRNDDPMSRQTVNSFEEYGTATGLQYLTGEKEDITHAATKTNCTNPMAKVGGVNPPNAVVEPKVVKVCMFNVTSNVFLRSVEEPTASCVRGYSPNAVMEMRVVGRSVVERGDCTLTAHTVDLQTGISSSSGARNAQTCANIVLESPFGELLAMPKGWRHCLQRVAVKPSAQLKLQVLDENVRHHFLGAAAFIEPVTEQYPERVVWTLLKVATHESKFPIVALASAQKHPLSNSRAFQASLLPGRTKHVGLWGDTAYSGMQAYGTLRREKDVGVVGVLDCLSLECLWQLAPVEQFLAPSAAICNRSQYMAAVWALNKVRDDQLHARARGTPEPRGARVEIRLELEPCKSGALEFVSRPALVDLVEPVRDWPIPNGMRAQTETSDWTLHDHGLALFPCQTCLLNLCGSVVYSHCKDNAFLDFYRSDIKARPISAWRGIELAFVIPRRDISKVDQIKSTHTPLMSVNLRSPFHADFWNGRSSKHESALMSPMEETSLVEDLHYFHPNMAFKPLSTPRTPGGKAFQFPPAKTRQARVRAKREEIELQEQLLGPVSLVVSVFISGDVKIHLRNDANASQHEDKIIEEELEVEEYDSSPSDTTSSLDSRIIFDSSRTNNSGVYTGDQLHLLPSYASVLGSMVAAFRDNQLSFEGAPTHTAKKLKLDQLPSVAKLLIEGTPREELFRLPTSAWWAHEDLSLLYTSDAELRALDIATETTKTSELLPADALVDLLYHNRKTTMPLEYNDNSRENGLLGLYSLLRGQTHIEIGDRIISKTMPNTMPTLDEEKVFVENQVYCALLLADNKFTLQAGPLNSLLWIMLHNPSVVHMLPLWDVGEEVPDDELQSVSEVSVGELLLDINRYSHALQCNECKVKAKKWNQESQPCSCVSLSDNNPLYIDLKLAQRIIERMFPMMGQRKQPSRESQLDVRGQEQLVRHKSIVTVEYGTRIYIKQRVRSIGDLQVACKKRQQITFFKRQQTRCDEFLKDLAALRTEETAEVSYVSTIQSLQDNIVVDSSSNGSWTLDISTAGSNETCGLQQEEMDTTEKKQDHTKIKWGSEYGHGKTLVVPHVEGLTLEVTKEPDMEDVIIEEGEITDSMFDENGHIETENLVDSKLELVDMKREPQEDNNTDIGTYTGSSSPSMSLVSSEDDRPELRISSSTSAGLTLGELGSQKVLKDAQAEWWGASWESQTWQQRKLFVRQHSQSLGLGLGQIVPLSTFEPQQLIRLRRSCLQIGVQGWGDIVEARHSFLHRVPCPANILCLRSDAEMTEYLRNPLQKLAQENLAPKELAKQAILIIASELEQLHRLENRIEVASAWYVFDGADEAPQEIRTFAKVETPILDSPTPDTEALHTLVAERLKAQLRAEEELFSRGAETMRGLLGLSKAQQLHRQEAILLLAGQSNGTTSVCMADVLASIRSAAGGAVYVQEGHPALQIAAVTLLKKFPHLSAECAYLLQTLGVQYLAVLLKVKMLGKVAELAQNYVSAEQAQDTTQVEYIQREIILYLNYHHAYVTALTAEEKHIPTIFALDLSRLYLKAVQDSPYLFRNMITLIDPQLMSLTRDTGEPVDWEQQIVIYDETARISVLAAASELANNIALYKDAALKDKPPPPRPQYTYAFECPDIRPVLPVIDTVIMDAPLQRMRAIVATLMSSGQRSIVVLADSELPSFLQDLNNLSTLALKSPPFVWTLSVPDNARRATKNIARIGMQRPYSSSSLALDEYVDPAHLARALELHSQLQVAAREERVLVTNTSTIQTLTASIITSLYEEEILATQSPPTRNCFLPFQFESEVHALNLDSLDSLKPVNYSGNNAQRLSTLEEKLPPASQLYFRSQFNRVLTSHISNLLWQPRECGLYTTRYREDVAPPHLPPTTQGLNRYRNFKLLNTLSRIANFVHGSIFITPQSTPAGKCIWKNSGTIMFLEDSNTCTDVSSQEINDRQLAKECVMAHKEGKELVVHLVSGCEARQDENEVKNYINSPSSEESASSSSSNEETAKEDDILPGSAVYIVGDDELRSRLCCIAVTASFTCMFTAVEILAKKNNLETYDLDVDEENIVEAIEATLDKSRDPPAWMDQWNASSMLGEPALVALTTSQVLHHEKWRMEDNKQKHIDSEFYSHNVQPLQTSILAAHIMLTSAPHLHGSFAYDFIMKAPAQYSLECRELYRCQSLNARVSFAFANALLYHQLPQTLSLQLGLHYRQSSGSIRYFRVATENRSLPLRWEIQYTLFAEKRRQDGELERHAVPVTSEPRFFANLDLQHILTIAAFLQDGLTTQESGRAIKSMLDQAKQDKSNQVLVMRVLSLWLQEQGMTITNSKSIRVGYGSKVHVQIQVAQQVQVEISLTDEDQPTLVVATETGQHDARLCATFNHTRDIPLAPESEQLDEMYSYSLREAQQHRALMDWRTRYKLHRRLSDTQALLYDTSVGAAFQAELLSRCPGLIVLLLRVSHPRQFPLRSTTLPAADALLRSLSPRVLCFGTDAGQPPLPLLDTLTAVRHLYRHVAACPCVDSPELVARCCCTALCSRYLGVHSNLHIDNESAVEHADTTEKNGDSHLTAKLLRHTSLSAYSCMNKNLGVLIMASDLQWEPVYDLPTKNQMIDVYDNICVVAHSPSKRPLYNALRLFSTILGASNSGLICRPSLQRPVHTLPDTLHTVTLLSIIAASFPGMFVNLQKSDPVLFPCGATHMLQVKSLPKLSELLTGSQSPNDSTALLVSPGITSLRGVICIFRAKLSENIYYRCEITQETVHKLVKQIFIKLEKGFLDYVRKIGEGNDADLLDTLTTSREIDRYWRLFGHHDASPAPLEVPTTVCALHNAAITRMVQMGFQYGKKVWVKGLLKHRVGKSNIEEVRLCLHEAFHTLHIPKPSIQESSRAVLVSYEEADLLRKIVLQHRMVGMPVLVGTLGNEECCCSRQQVSVSVEMHECGFSTISSLTEKQKWQQASSVVPQKQECSLACCARHRVSRHAKVLQASVKSIVAVIKDVCKESLSLLYEAEQLKKQQASETTREEIYVAYTTVRQHQGLSECACDGRGVQSNAHCACKNSKNCRCEACICVLLEELRQVRQLKNGVKMGLKQLAKNTMTHQAIGCFFYGLLVAVEAVHDEYHARCGALSHTFPYLQMLVRQLGCHTQCDGHIEDISMLDTLHKTLKRQNLESRAIENTTNTRNLGRVLHGVQITNNYVQNPDNENNLNNHGVRSNMSIQNGQSSSDRFYISIDNYRNNSSDEDNY